MGDQPIRSSDSTAGSPPASPWIGGSRRRSSAPAAVDAGAPGRARSRLRLFCFPYAGGGASAYHSWIGDLAPAVEVCPVQLPGREGRTRESLETSLAGLLARLTPALGPWLEPPYALFGHSMGGLVAFALAREIGRAGYPAPAKLVVSGAGAPHTPSTNPPLSGLPDEQFLERIRALDGTQSEVFENPELIELLLPVLRADLTLCETAAILRDPPIGCPIAAYGGASDEAVPRHRLEAWAELTSGAFRLRLFPGDHFFLHRRRDEVLAALVEDLV